MQSTLSTSAAFTELVAKRSAPSGEKPRRGLFTSIYSGMIAGQEARARAIVRQHMVKYDDAQLEQLGWSKAEIAALRTR